MKIKAIVLAFALLNAAVALAHDDACCAGMPVAEKKGACEATFAKLDLNAGQKAKMEKLAAEYDQGGCNKETMAKMEQGARKVLTKEQFAAWKAACGSHMSKNGS